MAGRAIHLLLRKRLQSQSYASPLFSSALGKQAQAGSESSGGQALRALAFIGAGAFGILSTAPIAYADDAERGSASLSFPWPHSGILSLYDQTLIRRGQQIYRSDCAACHGSMMVSYRDLAGDSYSEEAKAEIEVVDGPNDGGSACTRPSKLRDRFPKPYANEQAVGYANAAAYRTDLSIINKIREKLNSNPYFPGGAIVVPKMRNDTPVVYEDGALTTEIKMGKMFPFSHGQPSLKLKQEN